MHYFDEHQQNQFEIEHVKMVVTIVKSNYN